MDGFDQGKKDEFGLFQAFYGSLRIYKHKQLSLVYSQVVFLMVNYRNDSNMFSGKSILTGLFCLAIVVQLSLIMFQSRPNPNPAQTRTGVSTDTSINKENTSAQPKEGKPEEGKTDESDIQRAIQSSEEIDVLVRRACVQISDRDSGSQGTGVVLDVSENGFEVLTACHVVNGASAISVFAFEQKAKQWVRREYRTVELVRCDEDSDLATISVRTPISHLSAPPLEIFSKPTEENFLENERPVWTVSWTDDGKPVANERKIADRRMAQRTAGARPVSYWVLTSSSEPGMSGGPLLSIRGELIGIASGNSGGNAFYIDKSEILRFR